jgi:hypothetical protein
MHKMIGGIYGRLTSYYHGVLIAGFILLVVDKIQQYIDAKYKWKALDFEEFESNPTNVEAIREYRLNPRSKKIYAAT